MGGGRSDFDRLLADELDADDPKFGRVASFLSRVQSSAELPSVAALEDAHVARIRAALPALGTVPRAQRRERRTARTRRIIFASLAGVFAALTAGVGVATAMGLDPIGALGNVHLLPVPAGQLTPDQPHPSTPVGTQPPKPSALPTQANTDHENQGQGQVKKSESVHGKPTALDRGQSSAHANPKSTASKAPKATPKPDKSKTLPTQANTHAGG